jgi:hypothetical protein
MAGVMAAGFLAALRTDAWEIYYLVARRRPNRCRGEMRVTILHYLALAVSFAVLAFAYHVVFRVALTTIMLVIGTAGLAIPKLNLRSPKVQAILSYVEIIVTMLLSVISIAIIIATSIWQQPWFLFWNNTAVVAVLYLVNAIMAGLLLAVNPITRQQAAFTLISSPVVAVLILIAPSFPALFNADSARWAAMTGSLFVFLVGLGSTFSKVPQRMQAYAALEGRRQEVSRQLSRLQHIGNILPERIEWLKIQEGLRNLDKSYEIAVAALRAGRFAQADEAILHAEAETEGLNREVGDRVRLSLKDELKAKLNQSEVDCASLRAEFEVSGLPSDDLHRLETRIENLSQTIDSVVFDLERLPSQVEPFESVFTQIITMRTAVRFYDNIGAYLDRIRQEIADTEPQVALSEALGLITEPVRTLRAKLSGVIDEFRDGKIFSADDLVRKYRALREVASNHQTALNTLSAETKKKFFIEEVDDLDMDIAVPKLVATSDVATSVVLVRHEGKNRVKSVECEIDALRLKLPQTRLISISRANDAHFTVESFSITGESGGAARLTIKVRTLGGDQWNPRPFNVAVASSPWETARDVSAFVAPLGGVAVLFFWSLWRDMAIAGPLGVATGGTIGCLLFFIRRVTPNFRLRALGLK